MRVILLVAALAAAYSVHAQENARNLAAACAICHGTQGVPPSGAPVVPLAGMPREQLATQMRAFRDGQRPASVMHQIAKGYTDAQIDALASWFASQKR